MKKTHEWDICNCKQTIGAQQMGQAFLERAWKRGFPIPLYQD